MFSRRFLFLFCNPVHFCSDSFEADVEDSFLSPFSFDSPNEDQQKFCLNALELVSMLAQSPRNIESLGLTPATVISFSWEHYLSNDNFGVWSNVLINKTSLTLVWNNLNTIYPLAPCLYQMYLHWGQKPFDFCFSQRGLWQSSKMTEGLVAKASFVQ